MFQAALFRDSSTVEHLAVNQRVVGSNPTRGAERQEQSKKLLLFFVPSISPFTIPAFLFGVMLKVHELWCNC